MVVAVPTHSPPPCAAAFAYKLLLMSRYQSDCINVAFLPCLGHSQFPVPCCFLHLKKTIIKWCIIIFKSMSIFPFFSQLFYSQIRKLVALFEGLSSLRKKFLFSAHILPSCNWPCGLCSSSSCPIAWLMLIFSQAFQALAIDVWITLTWWLCIIYAAAAKTQPHFGCFGLIFHSTTFTILMC